MEALTEHGLVAEVASGTFAFKNKIPAAAIKLLWDKLSRFIYETLRQQKGVLVPNLGTFRVGPVVGEARKKVRPAFALLETRYAGVSQERPKHDVGGRCAIVQPNYGLLATASAVHRGACQRLVLELSQRLGAAVLAGRPLQVSFPSVGRLATNRAGRVEFAFDPLLREYFELERERVIAEMTLDDGLGTEGGGGGAGGREEGALGRVVRGLQYVHLHAPPDIRDPQQRDRPVSAPRGASPPSPSARVRRQAHAPYRGALLELWRLCRASDRINSGCVSRLALEGWLATEAGSALRHVAAATVLGLLARNTYGKTGKHILYKPFLDQLEAAVGDVPPLELSPRRVQSPRRVVEVALDSPAGAERRRQLEEAAAEVDAIQEATFSPLQPGAFPPPPLDVPPHTPGAASTPGQQHAWAPAAATPASAYPQHPHLQQHQYQQQHPFHHPHAAPAPASAPPYAVGPSGGGGGGGTPWGAAGGGGDAGGGGGYGYGGGEYGGGDGAPLPHHYYQDRLSPRSRRAFDGFNRVHFGNLEQARGRDYKARAVTPKVGEDELNRREAAAVRLADAVTPGGAGAAVAAAVAAAEEEEHAPYSRGTPQQPAVLSASRRRSPGPAAQILTLAHPTPSPPPQQHVPGLPTHYYPSQQQRAPPTPQQQQQQQQQPTPSQRPVATPGAQQQQQQQQAQRQAQQWAGRPSSARPPATPLLQQHQLRVEALEDPPISQYEIINEPDPVLRARKRDELARALQRNWSEQVREKAQVLEEIAEAESQWPYAPLHHPNDKRPASAVSRPQSVGPRRSPR